MEIGQLMIFTRSKKLKILFFDNATKLKTVNDLETRARGGMVSSLFKVSDDLQKRGHDVYVLTDIEEGGKTAAGATWIRKDCRIWVEDAFDVLVCNRGTGDGFPEVNARGRVLWTHDLPHNGFVPNPQTMKAFAATVFMSNYAERVWRTFYPAIGKSFRIPNGVDKTMFFPGEKEPGSMIFASAPNRGLKRLPLIYEAVKTRVEVPVKMTVFSNMKKLHPNEVRNEDDDGFSLAYKDCAEVGIDMRGPVPQPELAEHLGRVSLMVLPTDYPEICSNIILQSLASGTPIVTTGGLGSAGEWVRNMENGILTTFRPVDYMVHTVEIVRGIVSIFENESLHKRMIKAASETKIQTWEEVGLQWHKMLTRIS
jgi:glycosyltransferase involved in cell wall biosynthesis